MSKENVSPPILDEDLEEDSQPRNKRTCPNDSPDSRDQLLSKDVDICVHCKKKCTQTCEALQCDLCSSWVHASCEGFTKKQYASISQFTNSFDNLMFYCRLNNCVSRSKQLIFTRVETSLTFPTQSSEETLQSLVEEQDSLRQALSQLSQQVKELCCSNQTLEKEIKTTSASINQPPSLANPAPAPILNPSEVVNEYLDRERRKNNLILYNLPEPMNVQTATERSQSDLDCLSELFHSEFHIDNVEVTKCIRLGKAIQNKARPVLISVVDSAKRSSILRNASSLCKSEHHKNVYISPDLTIKERQIAKELRAELKRRRSQGEQNIIIRRGKIITARQNSSTTTLSN